MLRKKFSSVMLVGGMILRIASVMWNACSNRLRRIVWPRYSIVSFKNLQFFNFGAAPALFDSDKASEACLTVVQLSF